MRLLNQLLLTLIALLCIQPLYSIPPPGMESSLQPSPSSRIGGESLDLLGPIDVQLRALRNHNIQEAYDNASSEEFKSHTSLEDFKTFVEKHPSLTNHRQISVKEHSRQGNKATVTVILSDDTVEIPVQYILAVENGTWKVWSMEVLGQYSQEVMALLNNPDTLKPPIEEFLQFLHSQNMTQAYYRLTSKKFQQDIHLPAFRKFFEDHKSLLEFQRYELINPIINNGAGSIEVRLYSERIIRLLDFVLGIEDDQWKIWAMEVAKEELQPAPKTTPEESTTPKEATTSPTIPDIQEGVKGPLQFAKIEIGNKIDQKGAILDPQVSLSSLHEVIYIDLFVVNGTAGDKVIARLKHVETQSELPSISTTMQQSGNLIILLSFAPPAIGWPKGTYQLQAESTTGIKRTFTFLIN